VTRWGSPVSGEPAELEPGGRRSPGRALDVGQSASSAPILLAFTTVAAVFAATLALLPAALRRRPAGRVEARGDVDVAPDPASEPLAR
jgi:hypothetical protein